MTMTGTFLFCFFTSTIISGAIFDAVTFNTNIYKVNLSFHDITYIGLEYACDFIKTNINIIKFYLFDCKIDVFGSKDSKQNL